MTIRQIIIAAARRQRLSRYKLARLTGLDEGTLSRYWRGTRDISTSRADRLLAVLQIPLNPEKHRPNHCRSVADCRKRPTKK